jgi:hypothetical protein
MREAGNVQNLNNRYFQRDKTITLSLHTTTQTQQHASSGFNSQIASHPHTLITHTHNILKQDIKGKMKFIRH